ncbi:MAG: hypothetical protein ACKOYC_02150 [Bacteroidota bacterium]
MKISAFVWRICTLLACLCNPAWAQPYFDVAGVQYWQSPAAAHSDSVGEACFVASFSVPIKLDGGATLLVGANYDSRKLLDAAWQPNKLSALSVPITYVIQSSDSSRSLSVSCINRLGYVGAFSTDNTWQIGGMLIGGKRLSSTFFLRAGAYVKQEFFGFYFLPLVGCDWKISERWRLFGLMPSNMRLQHQLNEKLNVGMSFRSFSTSFRKPSGGYVKVFDNHVFAYGDLKVASKVVLVLEAGYSGMRRVSDWEPGLEFVTDSPGPLFKLGLFYRVPLP